jgi:hypothetical protein
MENKTTLIKCFSALVISGNGQRCNVLRKDLQEYLLQKNNGRYLSEIWKDGDKENPLYQRKIGEDVAYIVSYHFGELSEEHYNDTSEFREILEYSMKNLLWNGSVAKC